PFAQLTGAFLSRIRPGPIALLAGIKFARLFRRLPAQDGDLLAWIAGVLLLYPYGREQSAQFAEMRRICHDFYALLGQLSAEISNPPVCRSCPACCRRYWQAPCPSLGQFRRRANSRSWAPPALFRKSLIWISSCLLLESASHGLFYANG
uniref:Chromate transporter n=1 Tax=Macrostomum lignano TaxID=282301 RepID=A0A1I8F5H2_9PLAT